MNARKRVYNGKSSEARRQERRRALLDAARKVFGEQGFQAATVKMICREAGLTERYFYESFKNLVALFSECYDELVDQVLLDITQATLGSSRSRVELAEAALGALFNALRDDPLMARIILVEIYGVPYDQRRLFERSIQRFAQLIQTVGLSPSQQHIHSENALPPELNPELLASGLVGACIQMAVRWFVDDFKQAPEELVANCMLIFTGLGQRIGLDEPTAQR